MTKAKWLLVGTIMLGTVGYVGYRVLLSESARQNLLEMLRTTRDSYDKLVGALNVQDSPRAKQRAEANKRAVERQWERLGY